MLLGHAPNFGGEGGGGEEEKRGDPFLCLRSLEPSGQPSTPQCGGIQAILK